MRAYVHFPSQHWNPIWPRPVWVLCILPYSLWVYICTILLSFRSLYFLGVLHPFWLLKAFCLLHSFPWALQEGIDGDITFRMVYHSLGLIQQWVSELICIYSMGKLLWWWLRMTLIWVSQMFLEVILLSLQQNGSILLSLEVPDLSSPRFQATQTVSVTKSHLMKWVLNTIRNGWISPKGFVPVLHQYILQWGYHCRSKGL